MFDARLALTLAATLALAVPTFAQDKGAALADLDATRINPFQILIDFEFDGGACDDVGRAEIGALVDGALSVNFPVTANAEVCIMMIKEIEVKQAIETEDAVTRIDVTVTGPEGRIIGTGSTKVEID